MRVVLLNQYYPPSEAPTGLLLADLARALADAGHRVSVICSTRDYADPGRRFPAADHSDGVAVRRVRTTGFGRSSRLGRLIDYLSFMLGALVRLALARRPQVVVVLTTPPMLALPALLLARLKRARLVFWVMDVYPDLAFELGVLRRGSLGGRVLARLSRIVLRSADTVIALGEVMQRRLEACGARRVVTVHNWSDGQAIRPLPIADHALRVDWHWQELFVVLYSGNLGLAHEFDTVLEAARLLHERPQIRFAFVGTGPRLAELRREVERRRLDNVEFRPFMAQSELGQSLTAGDVHLVTLRSGVGGLLVPSKIYGILAAGRPTLYVGPSDSEIASLLREGECGVWVSPGDAHGLARAIGTYAADGQLRDEHGRRARALFETRFERRLALARLTALIETDTE